MSYDSVPCFGLSLRPRLTEQPWLYCRRVTEAKEKVTRQIKWCQMMILKHLPGRATHHFSYISSARWWREVTWSTQLYTTCVMAFPRHHPPDPPRICILGYFPSTFKQIYFKQIIYILKHLVIVSIEFNGSSSKFIRLCNHHPNTILKHFHHSEKILSFLSAVNPLTTPVPGSHCFSFCLYRY